MEAIKGAALIIVWNVAALATLVTAHILFPNLQ
jgi:hypothetical protein